MNQVFLILADGRKVGLSVAASKGAALVSARQTLSRYTASKERETCDYEHVQVVPMVQPVAGTGAAADGLIRAVLTRKLTLTQAAAPAQSAAATAS